MGFFFASIGTLAAIKPMSLISSSLNAQLVVLGPPYALTIFGAPLSILLVLRALDARPTEGTGPSDGAVAALARLPTTVGEKEKSSEMAGGGQYSVRLPAPTSSSTFRSSEATVTGEGRKWFFPRRGRRDEVEKADQIV
jgi:hypothetical protein